jgi:hypothetical protein
VAVTLAVLASSPAWATDPLAQPNWTTVPRDSIDPQIAVGPNHVVITQSSMVYVHRKDGTLVWSKSVMNLFGWLWDSAISPYINDGLNLPAGVLCFRNDPTVESVGGVDSYCLTDWYDARVLYDEFRDRFVIVALARNGAARCPNPDAVLNARRTKLVVAYSGTADPGVDTWVYTVFDAVPGENCPTAACRSAWRYEFGDAADYPTVGLQRNYLLIGVTHEGKPEACIDGDDTGYPDKTATVHVYQADRLATGRNDSTTCRACARGSITSTTSSTTTATACRSWRPRSRDGCR